MNLDDLLYFNYMNNQEEKENEREWDNIPTPSNNEKEKDDE